MPPRSEYYDPRAAELAQLDDAVKNRLHQTFHLSDPIKQRQVHKPDDMPFTVDDLSDPNCLAHLRNEPVAQQIRDLFNHYQVR